MNWADFLNADSDAIIFLDWYPTLLLINVGHPLQLYFSLKKSFLILSYVIQSVILGESGETAEQHENRL